MTCETKAVTTETEQAECVTRLAICPFCAAMGDELTVMDLDDGDGHAVVCNCCGAIGPSDYRPEHARRLWNGEARRAFEHQPEREAA